MVIMGVAAGLTALYLVREKPGSNNEQEIILNQDLKTYSSERFGVSFSYPKKYILTEAQGEGSEEYYVIGLMLPERAEETQRLLEARDDKTGLIHIGNSSIDIEWPANSINVLLYPKLPKQSLEQQIRPRLYPADTPVTSTTVAGASALRYVTEGLYTSDGVAVENNHWIIRFEAIRDHDGPNTTDDFAVVLDSLQLR